MASKISTLKKDVADMEEVMNDASTPQNVKKAIEPALKKAKQDLAELEKKSAEPAKVEKKEPVKKEPAKKAVQAHKKYKKEVPKEEHKEAPKEHHKAPAKVAKKKYGKLQKYKEAAERRKSQGGVPKQFNDIEKDAKRSAISIKGKRISANGNVYYEYRDNRYDKNPKKFPKLEDGGMMADGGEVKFDYELKVQPDFKYKNIANRWLEDNLKDSLKYKLAILILREKHNPDEILGIKDDNKYARLLRSLENAKGSSDHEMEWRTENYSLAEAEKWTKDSLREMFYVHGEKMADGGCMECGGYMAEGGEVNEGNTEMVMSNIHSIKHHADEISHILSKNVQVEAWVSAKAERAATDLSDITHYLDGRSYAEGEEHEMNEEHYARGGEVRKGSYVVVRGGNGSGRVISMEDGFATVRSRGEEKSYPINMLIANEDFFEHGGYMADGGMMAKGGESDYKYKYMLLSRLKQDNEYYLNYGNRNEKSLWAGSVDGQIKEMKKLWNELPIKPEWLSMEDIEKYEREMKMADGGMMAKGGEVKVGDIYYDVRSNAKNVMDNQKVEIIKVEKDNISFKIKNSVYDISPYSFKQNIDNRIWIKDGGYMAKGGSFMEGGSGYEGQSILLTNTSSPIRHRFIGKELVLEEKQPSGGFSAYVRNTGEKVPFDVFPDDFEQYKKGGMMTDGGEIDWGADLGDGFSIGNDVYITDSKSMFRGKTGFVSGLAGKDLLVTISENGNDRSVVVRKKGVQKLDAPEMAKGGDIYDDMDEDIEFANKKVKMIASSLKDAGFNILKVEDAEYDTDADIKLSDKLNVQVGLDGNLSIVIQKQEGKFTFIDCKKSYPTLLQKLKEVDPKYMEKGGHLVGNQSKLDLNKNGKLDSEDFKMLRKDKKEGRRAKLAQNTNKMKAGGSFEEGVKAIEKNLVGKKVAAKYQSKYGKKYNKEEAHEAASNIKGAIRKREENKTVAKYKK